MPRKNLVSEEQRQREAALFKPLFDEYKSKTEGMNQTVLADMLDLSQGSIGQYCSGKSAIPLETLVDLALIMGFNPLHVRPEIEQFINKLNLAIKNTGEDDLNQRFIEAYRKLSPDSLRISMLNTIFLAEQEQESP